MGSGPAGPCVSVAVREGAGPWTLRPAPAVGFGSVLTLWALGISKYWGPGAEGGQGLEGSRKSKLSGLKDKQMGGSEVKGQKVKRSTERLHLQTHRRQAGGSLTPRHSHGRTACTASHCLSTFLQHALEKTCVSPDSRSAALFTR